MKLNEKHSRTVLLDCVRTLAITLVVVVHTNAFFFTQDICVVGQVLSHVFGYLGVPLFVILTGYFMVGRSYDLSYLKQYLLHNVFPIILAFELWNVLWYVLEKIPAIHYPGGGFPISTETMIKGALFIGDTGTAMWYMPMIIGLYVGMPLISWLCTHHMEKSWSGYGLLIVALMVYFGTVVPTFSAAMDYCGHPVTIHSVLNLNIFGASVWGESVWVLYCVAGYLIRIGFFDRFKTISVAILGFAVPLAMMICTENAAVLKGIKGLCMYASLFNVVLSVSIVILALRVSKLIDRLPEIAKRFITFIGRYTFSVYMIHLFVIGAWFNVLFQPRHDLPAGDSFSDPIQIAIYIIYIILVVIISAIVAWILGRNKWIRKWLLLIK